MCLRLFWRAPRISTQSAVEDAAPRFFPTTFEPTGDSSRYVCSSHISRVKNRNLLGKQFVCFPSGRQQRPYSLFLEPGGELFALFLQFRRNDAAKRRKKFLMAGQFSLPLLVIDPEKFDDVFM